MYLTNSATPRDVSANQSRNKDVCYSVATELTFKLHNLMSALRGMEEADD